MPPSDRPSKSPPPCEPGCEVSRSSCRPWARRASRAEGSTPSSVVATPRSCHTGVGGANAWAP
eukprot:3778659-Alexandrium_andersonii.AAC.1